MGKGGEGMGAGEKGRGRSSPNIRDALTPRMIMFSKYVFKLLHIYVLDIAISLQCFDTVGWVTGRVSGL